MIKISITEKGLIHLDLSDENTRTLTAGEVMHLIARLHPYIIESEVRSRLETTTLHHTHLLLPVEVE
jgi:hypothetical protein